MLDTLKLSATVLPGHRIEIMSPELPEGANVEVVVTLPRRPVEQGVALRFATLAARWYEESAPLSSVSQMAMLPAYQEIIGMGREAVPLLLRELQKEPGHWFWALRAITGEDPIPPDSHGNVREMAAAWLGWGRQHGFI